MKYRILVACGTGAASSTFVATRLTEALAERGIDVITSQCNIANVASNLTGIDLLLTTSKIQETLEVPSFLGIPFLTGIGTDQLVDQIVEALKKRRIDK